MTTVDAWLLAFCRAAPVVALHPIFGGRAVPRPVTIGVAAALASAIAAGDRTGASFAIGAAIANVATGAVIGLVGQAVFGTIESAGRFVDDARGANVGRLYAPQIESAASPLGHLDLAAALAVYWGLGLHRPFIAMLAAGSTPALAMGLDGWLDAATALTRAGLTLAGSAAAACVLVDVLLGLVNRASPQTSAFQLGQPLKLAAAVLATALGAPARVSVWGELFRADLAWAARVLGTS